MTETTWYATTRSKSVICIPLPEKLALRTVCGKTISHKVDQNARNGRFKNMELCKQCVHQSEVKENK